MSRPRSSRSSSYGLREAEYAAAAAYGQPALSDRSSDPQMARALSDSRSHFSPTVPRSLGRIAELEYNTAAAYGEPALSDAASDAQMARAISESKRTAGHGHSRAYSYASSSASSSAASSTLLGWGSASSSASSVSSYSPSYAASDAYYPPKPTAHAQYTPSPSGPPLVVRAPSPTASLASQRSAYSYHAPLPAPAPPSPTPSRPLSPLLMGGPTRLRTPSVRSAASTSTSNSHASPIRSASSAASVRSISSISSMRSASTARSTQSAQSHIQSVASLLSSVARSARHAPLESAAQTLRASLSASPSVALSHAGSAASMSHAGSVASGKSASTPRGSIRAGSVRSVATSASEAAARAKEEEEALAQLHTLATSPVRCANPGCGTLIPAAGFDDITFPTPFTAPTPANPYTLPPPLLAALHARCPVCTTAHCRGCGLPTGCDGCAEQTAAGSPWPSPSKSWSSPSPSNAKANNRCPIPTHCPGARALGVLAALVAFDRAHLASLEAKPGRATDKPLLGALHALVHLLETPAPRLRLHPSPATATPGAFPSATSGSSASSSRSLRSISSTGAGLLLRQSWDGGSVSSYGGGSVSSYGGGSESSYGGGSAYSALDEAAEAHPALPALLARSRVLGYAMGLLHAGAAPPVDVGTWMARAPAYGAVLSVLKALGGEGGCAEVLVRPVETIPVSGQGGGGLEAWLRASPAQNRRWERDRVRERERAERERLRNAARGGVGAERQEEGVSLQSLIRTLEPARLALLRLAGATRFGPTVETAHALCDGVLYLLLHDLLEA